MNRSTFASASSASVLAGAVGAICCASSASADIAQFYLQSDPFYVQVASSGKQLKGFEDFEYANVNPGEKLPFPNSLQNGVPAPGLPGGINSDNLIIQTNITPGPCPTTLNPSSNQNALWINGAGFIGSNSIKVGTDEFLYNLFSSLDLVFTTNDKTAISLDVSTYAGFAQGHQGFNVCAYDTNNVPIGNFLMPAGAPEPNKNFIGIWSPVPIGRINIWGIFAVPQPFAVDNIEMWVVPGPGVLGTFGLAGAMAGRRRR